MNEDASILAEDLRDKMSIAVRTALPDAEYEDRVKEMWSAFGALTLYLDDVAPSPPTEDEAPDES